MACEMGLHHPIAGNWIIGVPQLLAIVIASPQPNAAILRSHGWDTRFGESFGHADDRESRRKSRAAAGRNSKNIPFDNLECLRNSNRRSRQTDRQPNHTGNCLREDRTHNRPELSCFRKQKSETNRHITGETKRRTRLLRNNTRMCYPPTATHTGVWSSVVPQQSLLR